MAETNKNIIKGKLVQKKSKGLIIEKSGKVHFKSYPIWHGYIEHWEGLDVKARLLHDKDYETGKSIIIIWPDKQTEKEEFIELYYNERLIKYPASTLGHIAVNVNGNIYNFSHLINENEIISEEEYFYRPALGKFAPHPETGLFNVYNKDRPYLDKFGRLFMRSIHVLRVKGAATAPLKEYYDRELDIIHSTPLYSKRPEKYRDFSIFKRSCSTIIRDGLKKCLLDKIAGIFPRDLFVNTAFNLEKHSNRLSISVEHFKLEQLKVDEAPYSKMTPLLNPLNRIRNKFI